MNGIHLANEEEEKDNEECYVAEPNAVRITDDYDEGEQQSGNDLGEKTAESAMQPLIDYFTTHMYNLYSMMFFSGEDL